MNIPRPTETTGSMAGHVRKGRIFSSPLAATGMLQVEDWFKEDLPDLLWPILVLSERGNDAIFLFIEWQKSVQDRLAAHNENERVAEMLDGRLTHLAKLVGRLPGAREVVVEEARRQGLLSDGVRGALASYPHLPARWLIEDAEASPAREAELELVRAALTEIISDGHREALIKCLRTWSTVNAGTFRSSAETIDMLRDYPANPANRTAADSVVRAMWGAHKGTVELNDPGHFDDAVKWARAFWVTNSATSMCIRKRDLEAQGVAWEAPEGEASPHDADVVSPAAVPEGGENLRRFAMDILSSFVEALETSPTNLYESERQEVVSGLVTRAGRELVVVLGAPELWCLEHGAHVMRTLVETKIYIHWMARQDPEIYRQFQEYGAGKAKLYSRIMEELPRETRTAGFRESVDELERLSHNDHILDHRVVDTRDTFAGGKSIRAMAQEADLLDFYRQAYSLASGVSHSEWWSLEAHVMEPCLNVLHGMHKIPSLSLNQGGNVELAMAWVDQLYSLVRAGLRVLGADESVVSEAFSWLETATADSTDEGDAPSALP